MKLQNLSLLLCTLIAFSACSEDKTNSQDTVVKKTPITTQTQETKKPLAKKHYSLDEIYNSMCIQCHSSDGSGNTEKLTPSMKGQTKTEIQKALEEVENEKGHVIMEHNREQILKQGMEYSAKDMAEYMYKRFK